MCSNYHFDNCGKQGGATLVVALVVVLLVVMLATRMGSDYLLLFRTLENQSELQQARSYLKGAESVAREVLLQDLASGSTADSELELWARPINLVLTEGQLSACLMDLQGRLNLNDLDAAESQGFSSAQRRFIRLLQVLELDEPLDQSAAITIANAVFDWLDGDSNPRYPGGGEVSVYLQDTAAGRPANQSFADVSELLLVRGMTPAIVAALTPWLSVWGNGSVNLNTIDAHLQGPVLPMDGLLDEARRPVLLRTLNNGDSLLPLSEQAALEIAGQRSNRGGLLENVELFGQGMLGLQAWDLEGVGFSSEFFLLQASMQIGERSYGLESVVQRTRDLTGRPLVAIRARKFVNTDFDNNREQQSCVSAIP